MKVNELKAMFQKNGAIKTQPGSSVYTNTIKPSNANVKTISHIPQQPQKIPIIVPHPIQNPKPEVQERQIGKINVKNNDFLNELNKKLQNKTIKPKHYEEQIDTHEVIIEAPKVVEQVVVPRTSFNVRRQSFQVLKPQPQIARPIQVPKAQQKKIEQPSIRLPQRVIHSVVQQQQQLDFNTIIDGNLTRSRFQPTDVKIRYGINQRYPTTKQNELLFYELQEQRKSEVEEMRIKEESTKENTVAISYLRNTKDDKPKGLKSVYYTKIPKNDKVKRIQRIVDSIFAKNSSETIVNPRLSKTQVNYTLMQLAIEQKPTTLKSSLIQALLMQSQQPRPLLSQQTKIQEPIYKTNDDSRKMVNAQMQQRVSTNKVQDISSRPKSMLGMNQQMLNQINSKIKRREDTIKEDSSKPNEGLARQKSPLGKKKKHFQQFDDN